MRNKIFGLLTALITTVSVNAQEEIVLEVAGEKIPKKTFVEMYQKNNTSPDKIIDRKDLDEYLELFINYKMKLAQARELGLDTIESYVSEVNSYREQLVAPYLNDASITDTLIQEAYDRMKEIIRASHILIGIPANANPDDTLSAYQKAMNIRGKALAGEDFGKLAMEYSEDPSAKDRTDPNTNATIKGNKGDLGYFTSLNMIYPFETACYSMKVGDISMPVRTRFGYHVIKLTDRRPAFCSTMNIAHIWISNNNHSEEECERLIKEAKAKLNENISFDSVARMYSDDRYSAEQKGILNNQRINSMPAEYIEQIIGLELGKVSEPFKSNYGWHIVMPVSYVPLPSLEELRTAIEDRISKDERSFKTLESFAEKSKKEYGFFEDKTKLDAVVAIVTDSVFSATWKVPENFNSTEELFRIGDYSFTQLDFAKQIEKNQRKQMPIYIPEFVNKAYNTVVLEQVVEYADSKLESKYPELKATIDEFRDGVLIFAITDKFVWNKSLIDSTGLEEFYQANKDNYKWDKRAEVTIWNINKEKDIKKMHKALKKAQKKGWTNQETKEYLAKKFKIKEDVDNIVKYKWGKFEKGSDKMIDRLVWGLDSLSENTIVIDSTSKRNIAVIFHRFIPEEVKTLNECKGIVTSDYQLYLEQEWIRDLRKKYSYKVNREVYNSIK